MTTSQLSFIEGLLPQSGPFGIRAKATVITAAFQQVTAKYTNPN